MPGPTVSAAEQEKKSPKMKDYPWVCHNCQSMLGVIGSDRETVRIKYKDLYVTTSGGTVTVLCRKCGAPNILSSDGSNIVKSFLGDVG